MNETDLKILQVNRDQKVSDSVQIAHSKNTMR